MRREELFARDEFRCVYCGGIFPADELTVDHVQARVRGGDRSAGNLVTACAGCNVLKGHRRLSEFLAESMVARENFFRYAKHVWPRHLRSVQEEIEARERKREERDRLQMNTLRLIREARQARGRHEVKKTRNMLLKVDQRELRRLLGSEGDDLCRQINTWLRSTAPMFQ